MWLLLGLLFASPLGAHTGPINVMVFPHSAAGDGMTDDTAAIESALAAGSEIYLPPGFTFLTDGHTVRESKRITCGHGAVLKQRVENLIPHLPGQILSFSAPGSTIEGCTLDGNRDQAKLWPTTKERACLVVDAAQVTVRNVELKECMTTGLYAASETEKPGLALQYVYIHDTGLGIRMKHVDFAQISHVDIDAIHNEGALVHQHAVDIWHSEGFQMSNVRLRNLGGDTGGLSGAVSGLTIIESSGEIANLYLADVTTEILGQIGISLLSSSITGANWKILRYAGVPLELQSNSHLTLSNFLIDCAYRSSVAQAVSHGVTISAGGQYFSSASLMTRTNSNFYNREAHLSNGVITRCTLGVRQSTGNLSLDNVELTGMLDDGLYASNNYLGEGSFPTAPRDTELSGTVLSNVVARYNGGAGLHLENGTVQIRGGLFVNNGQDPTKPEEERGGIVDSSEGSVGSVFITGATFQDTQRGMIPANASIDWSAYVGPFVAGETIQFLLTKSVDYFAGQRIGLLGTCLGERCSAVDDESKNDLIVRITDVSLDLVTAVIVTPGGSYVGTVTAGEGTLTTVPSGTIITGSGTSLDTQIRGPSWIRAGGQYRRVNRTVNPTTAKLESAFSPPLANAPFLVSQVATQLIPSQQYGIRLRQASEAQLIGNRVSGNVSADHSVANLKQFVTTDVTSPLMAERTGPNAVKFSVQVGGGNLGLSQKGSSPNAHWISGAVSGKGYVVGNGPNFGIKDAFVLSEKTLAATFAGTIQSSRPTDLGWKVQKAPNQSCNTTCVTGACAVAINIEDPSLLVDCADESADVCACAG